MFDYKLKIFHKGINISNYLFGIRVGKCWKQETLTFSSVSF